MHVMRIVRERPRAGGALAILGGLLMTLPAVYVIVPQWLETRFYSPVTRNDGFWPDIITPGSESVRHVIREA